MATRTPDELERSHTLRTAVERYDELRARDSLAIAGRAPLSVDEALEMLALGELIARKAGYGRQLGVRSARAGGASWTQIGAALGTSKQAAWETHNRWIDSLAAEHGRNEFEGLDDEAAAAARRLADRPEAEGVAQA